MVVHNYGVLNVSGQCLDSIIHGLNLPFVL